MSSPDSRPEKSGKKKKSALMATLICGLLLLLALLFKNCLGLGLGTGDGDADGDAEKPDPVQPALMTPSDARAATPAREDAGPVPARAPCELALDGQGLYLAGQVVAQEQAVATCKVAGKANLKVAGDARTGTYKDLTRALEAAGVLIFEKKWPTALPPSDKQPPGETDQPNQAPAASSAPAVPNPEIPNPAVPGTSNEQ